MTTGFETFPKKGLKIKSWNKCAQKGEEVWKPSELERNCLRQSGEVSATYSEHLLGGYFSFTLTDLRMTKKLAFLLCITQAAASHFFSSTRPCLECLRSHGFKCQQAVPGLHLSTTQHNTGASCSFISLPPASIARLQALPLLDAASPCCWTNKAITWFALPSL